MPALNTPPVCTLCGDSGHNIRYCKDPIIPYLLVKVRCKKIKSVRRNDMFVLFNWLHRLIPTELRAVLIYKYRITPKTASKHKLVAIIMDYEFPDVGENAFWKVYLPMNFNNTRPVDAQNEDERQLILRNIFSYNEHNNEDPTMLPLASDELICILLRLIEENRHYDRTLFDNNITYTKCKCNEEEESIECSICYDEISKNNKVRLNCNHEFCGSCIAIHIKKTPSANVKCPMCRTDISTVNELTL